MKGDKMKKDNNYLEFYQKATKLRKELKRRKRFWYCHVLDDLVLLFFQNGNKFPNTIIIKDANNHRLDLIKEILMKLGFFEKHSIDEYDFLKKKKREKSVLGDYNEYYFEIVLKDK